MLFAAFLPTVHYFYLVASERGGRIYVGNEGFQTSKEESNSNFRFLGTRKALAILLTVLYWSTFWCPKSVQKRSICHINIQLFLNLFVIESHSRKKITYRTKWTPCHSSLSHKIEQSKVGTFYIPRSISQRF